MQIVLYQLSSSNAFLLNFKTIRLMCPNRISYKTFKWLHFLLEMNLRSVQSLSLRLFLQRHYLSL